MTLKRQSTLASASIAWHLSVKRNLSVAAANGSNRIALRCLRSPGINALTCLNDLY